MSSPCTHQRGKLCVPPQAAPSRLEALRAAFAPGMGGFLPQLMPQQTLLHDIKAPLAYEETSLLLCLHPPGAGNKKESPSLALPSSEVEGQPNVAELRASLVPQTQAGGGGRVLTAASQCHPALLPLSDLLQRRNLCARWGFSVQTQWPLLIPLLPIRGFYPPPRGQRWGGLSPIPNAITAL